MANRVTINAKMYHKPAKPHVEQSRDRKRHKPAKRRNRDTMRHHGAFMATV